MYWHRPHSVAQTLHDMNAAVENSGGLNLVGEMYVNPWHILNCNFDVQKEFDCNSDQDCKIIFIQLFPFLPSIASQRQPFSPMFHLLMWFSFSADVSICFCILC